MIKIGLLSGKYNDGSIPQGSRLDTNPELKETFNKLFSETQKEKSVKMLGELKLLADELGLYTKNILSFTYFYQATPSPS